MVSTSTYTAKSLELERKQKEELQYAYGRIEEGGSVASQIQAQKDYITRYNQELADLRAGSAPEVVKREAEQLIQYKRGVAQRRIDFLSQMESASLQEANKKLEQRREDDLSNFGRYSSAAGAAGYSSASGRVEVGAGDARGRVVSLSKSDEEIRAMKKDYTKSATLDPRSDFFQPVESGIFTPGIQAKPSDAIKAGLAEPQRPSRSAKTKTGDTTGLFASPDYIKEPPPRAADVLTPRKERPKAAQGVPDNLFASPEFVQKEQQRQADLLSNKKAIRDAKTSLITSFGDNIIIEKKDVLVQPQAPRRSSKTKQPTETSSFAVSLSEGAPAKPRELTQEQVNMMTPEQYAVYRAEFDAYNTWVENENRKIKEQNKAQKKANLLDYTESKKNILGFIGEAKEAGYKTITINTKQGSKEVPIDRAFKDIMSSKDVLGVSVIPNIPEGYTVAGPIASPIFVPDNTKLVISQDKSGAITEQRVDKKLFPTPERKPDFLEATVKKWDALKTDNPLIEKAVKPFYKEVTGGMAGIVELERMGGDLLKPTEPRQKLELPTLTASSEYVGGVIGGGKKAIESGNFKYFVGGTGEAAKKAAAVAKEQGVIATAFGALGFAFPFGGGAAIKSVKSLTKIKQVPTLLKGVVAVKPKPGTKLYRGTNMMREKIPTDVFKIDTAIPFAKEQVRLGQTTATGIVKKTPRPVQKMDVIPTKEMQKFDQGVKVQPVKEDPFYTPRPEMKRFRKVDYTKTFESDTAEAGFTVKPVELGSGTTKTITPTQPFTKTEIALGESTKGIRIQKIGLGRAATKPPEGIRKDTFKSTYGQPVKEVEGFTPEKPKSDVFQDDVFSRQQVRLGTGTVKTPPVKFDQGVKVQPVKEDPFYTPRPEMKRFRKVDYTKTFESDTKLAPFIESRVRLGRGLVTKLGGKGKPTTPKKPTKPKSESPPVTKSGQILLLEKPAPTAFKTTSIELGKGKTTVIASSTTAATVTAGPLLGQAAADALPETPTGVSNQTEGNQTDIPPQLQEDDAEIDFTPSVLEPQSITAQRPAMTAAIIQSGFAGVDTSAAVRARERVASISATKPMTGTRLKSNVRPMTLFRTSQPQVQKQPQRQAQKTQTPFPFPQRTPLRLVQPEAFKFKQPLLLRTIPPRIPPKRPILGIPFRKKGEKKKRIEEDIKLSAKEFIGNVPVSEIIGVYKRPDIIYGEKRSSSLALKDITGSSKGRMVRGRKVTLVSKPQQFFTKSKRQSAGMRRQLSSGNLKL